jgi:hypothetical protein
METLFPPNYKKMKMENLSDLDLSSMTQLKEFKRQLEKPTTLNFTERRFMLENISKINQNPRRNLTISMSKTSL